MCGKACWYGRDLPELDNYFIAESQQPSAMIIEDHAKLHQQILFTTPQCGIV